MPRRLRKSRPVTGPDVLRAELAESNAHNRELTAENELLRAELETAQKKASAATFQLDWHKGEVSRLNALLSAELRRTNALRRTADADAAALKREREHVAGSCSHAADLRALTLTLTALERRVAELQAVNEGYEASGWQPSSMAMSGGKRGRG